jgi:hypothetical protein
MRGMRPRRVSLPTGNIREFFPIHGAEFWRINSLPVVFRAMARKIFSLPGTLAGNRQGNAR